MPEGYPWGMPLKFGVGFHQNAYEVPTTTIEVPTLHNPTFTSQPRVTFPQVTMSVSQPIVTNLVPVVHTIPYVNNEVYHDLGDNMDSRGCMEDLQEQFNKMQLEIKTIRRNDLFG